MDHAVIDDEQIAERYVTGRLPAEDRTRFEDHFVGCLRCQERLEAVEGLRRSLALLTAEAPAERPPERPGAPGRLTVVPLAPRLLRLAAALLVGAGISGMLLLGELGRTRRELEGARQASDESRRNEGGLRRTVENERRAREQLAEKLRAAQAMPVGAAVFTLNATRGVDTGPPGDRIVLGESPAWIVLVVDRPGPRPFPRYRVRLFTADHRPLGDALTPSAVSGDQLAVAFPAGLLTPGDFALTIEGLPPGGRSEVLSSCSFRAVRKP